MHQYKPTQIDKSRSVLVALKWVEHAIKFIYETVCNNVFAEENCFFYETGNDLLGSGRLLYSFAPDHCASLNHADRKFYLFNISSTWRSVFIFQEAVDAAISQKIAQKDVRHFGVNPHG